MQFRLRTLLIVLALLPPILAVVAPPVMEWLTKEQAPPPAKVAKPVTTPAPFFAVYTLGKVKPADAHLVVSTILAGSKSARMQTDVQTGTVSLLATPADHAAVQAMINALQQVPPPTTFAELERIKTTLPPGTVPQATPNNSAVIQNGGERFVQ